MTLRASFSKVSGRAASLSKANLPSSTKTTTIRSEQRHESRYSRLCAIAILSASQVRAEPLNPDESQFTGWLHAISEMQDKPIRYHSQPIANFLQQLERINGEVNQREYTRQFDSCWETPSEFPAVWRAVPGLRRGKVCQAL
jgi:hypothetical protein